MQEFLRKFTQLKGKEVRVVLEHYLFDRQAFYCEALQTVNDDKRIGVVLKSQEKFLYKQDVKVAEVQDDVYSLSDGRFTIIVNKL